MMDETSESDLTGGQNRVVEGSSADETPVTLGNGEKVEGNGDNGSETRGAPQTESDVEDVSSESSSHNPAPDGDSVNGYDDGRPIRRGQPDGQGDATPHQYENRHPSGIQSPRPSVAMARASISTSIQDELPPAVIKPIPIGDPKIRSKLRFEVVTARVVECAGKKHVAYTIMMKRVGHEPHPAVIERRYSDFCFIYECILKSFHPSILGDFLFPKKVIIGNFKAEVISERTDAFHKFLNLIANCDNLLYSDYFYSFLSSEEHNEAVSHLKLARYAEATPLLQSIFYVREKLLSIASIHVFLVTCELVACLAADVATGPLDMRKRKEEAFAFVEVAMKSFELVIQGRNPEEIMVVEQLRIPFLKLALELAIELGQDKKPYERQLSELRYAGVRLENSQPLLEVIRNRYIHRASHTSKIS